ARPSIARLSALTFRTLPSRARGTVGDPVGNHRRRRDPDDVACFGMDRVEVSPTSETGRLPVTGTGVRLAELVATLSLGIDLGFGQPMEHVLRQCLIALRLAERVGF